MGFGPVCWAVCCLLSFQTSAQTKPSTGPTTEIAPVLRISPMLEERISDKERNQSPVFLEGQSITGRPDLDVVIEGNARLRRSGLSVKADRIEYDQTQDTLKAQGQVRISRDGNRFEGPQLELQADTFQGQFKAPTFVLS